MWWIGAIIVCVGSGNEYKCVSDNTKLARTELQCEQLVVNLQATHEEIGLTRFPGFKITISERKCYEMSIPA